MVATDREQCPKTVFLYHSPNKNQKQKNLNLNS